MKIIEACNALAFQKALFHKNWSVKIRKILSIIFSLMFTLMRISISFKSLLLAQKVLPVNRRLMSFLRIEDNFQVLLKLKMKIV